MKAVGRLAAGWTVRGSNPGASEGVRTSKQALGPTQPHIEFVPGLFPWSKVAGAWH